MAEEQGISLLQILDELAALLATARQMPMSASVLVNKAEALDLLDAARSVVPEQVAEAEGIVSSAQDVVERANAKAAMVIQGAELRAKKLIEDQQIVAEAKARAAQIVTEAEAKAAQLMEEANDYCDRTLAQFEIELGHVAKQVQAGRKVIQERLAGEEQ